MNNKAYAVAAALTEYKGSGVLNISVRLQMFDATSEEEALGKFVLKSNEELPTHDIHCRPVVAEIKMGYDPEFVKSGIMVWKFQEAPQELRDLSKNGGDEDWIAFIPKKMKDDYIPWLAEGTSFGCCTVEEHQIDDGIIKIGCHA